MSPRIDKREYRDHLAILESARIRLGDRVENGLRSHLLPGWTAQAVSGESMDLGLVMNRLFARLMTIVGERINRIPEKHFAAFLDMVGVERLPGSPARVPVTFVPTAGAPPGQQVPKGTQVATTQTENDPAVFFETEESFELTPSKLNYVVTMDPAEDRWRDISNVVLGDEQGDSAIILRSTEDDESVEHVLYLAHDAYFSSSEPQDLTIEFDIATSGEGLEAANVRWEVYGESGWSAVPLSLVENQSTWLSAVEGSSTTILRDFRGTEPSIVEGDAEERPRHWIRAVLATRLSGTEYALPELNGVKLLSESPESVAEVGFFPEQAFFNTFPIDLNRDFYPFGERPVQNDAFYLSSPIFYNPQPSASRTVRLTLKLVSIPGQSIGTFPSGDASLAWEYWSSSLGRWHDLVPDPELPETLTSNMTDAEKTTFLEAAVNFLHGTSDEITLAFVAKSDIEPRVVNGEEGYWIRARIATGSYAENVSLTIDVTSSIGIRSYSYTIERSEPRPPLLSVADLKISYSGTESTEVDPDACISINHFDPIDHTAALTNENLQFLPYRTMDDLGETYPALYFGYGSGFGAENVRVSKLLVLERPDLAQLRQEVSAEDPPQIVWEYWSADETWVHLDAEDQTRSLSSSSTVAFTAPSDMASSRQFGREAFWIRARLSSGGALIAERGLREVHLNSVWARSVRNIENEVLGSGTGERPLTLRLSRTPVLPGEVIRVREDNPLPAEVLESLEAEEAKLVASLGTDPVKVLRSESTANRGDTARWVRWYPVPNFSFSGADDRHYVIDRVTGEVTFNALPVLRGRDNVRVDRYLVNQGEHARRAAGINTVQQLVTSLPYVDSVTNRVSAQGGAGPETPSDALARGPRLLKHRNRAVTIEDYEVLVREANPGIVLVKTLPTTNRNLQYALGEVTMLIVPYSTEAHPQPTPETLDQIREYLIRRGPETVAHRIHVIGPSYVEASVAARVVPINAAQGRVIGLRVSQALAEFLHPLTGGGDGCGWPFGRHVHISEIYTVIEAVAGVDFVPHAEFIGAADPAARTERVVGPNELACSGNHAIEVLSSAAALNGMGAVSSRSK